MFGRDLLEGQAIVLFCYLFFFRVGVSVLLFAEHWKKLAASDFHS